MLSTARETQRARIVPITRMRTAATSRGKNAAVQAQATSRQAIEMRWDQRQIHRMCLRSILPSSPRFSLPVLSGAALIVAREKMAEGVSSTYDPGDDREHKRDRREP
jgi:hypothetical protein